MAKRKRDTSLRHDDPAVKYRARLEARRAAAHEAQTTRWSPSIRGRLTLVFARLLYTATAPATRSSGLRKRFLERRLFRAVTRHAATRKTLYRASKAVLSAAGAGDPVAFKRSRGDMLELWRAASASRRTDKLRGR